MTSLGGEGDEPAAGVETRLPWAVARGREGQRGCLPVEQGSRGTGARGGQRRRRGADSGAPRLVGARLGAFLELTKPRITQLVLLTVAAGFYLGARAGVNLRLLGNTLVGVALVAAGTNAFNQLRERDVDARMRRTQNRPLPSGRVSPRAAAWFAAVISVVGVGYLVLTVNRVTAGLAALTLASYVLLYTPLKRTTTLNTVIGAVPGALPIVGGWTAAGGPLGPAVVTLFAILFLWQLPHFLALAWVYREDYRRGGLAMVSVQDPHGHRTGRMALCYAVLLLPVSLLPTLWGVTGAWYLWGALALGLAYIGASRRVTRAATTAGARRLFVVSIIYLPALLVLMVLAKVTAPETRRASHLRIRPNAGSFIKAEPLIPLGPRHLAGGAAPRRSPPAIPGAGGASLTTARSQAPSCALDPGRDSCNQCVHLAPTNQNAADAGAFPKSLC